MKDDTSVASAIAGGLVLPLLGALIIYRGWFVSILWAWFVTPTFSVAALSIPQAIGVSAVFSAMHPSGNTSKDSEGFKWLAIQLLTPLFGLGIGWIVKQFL